MHRFCALSAYSIQIVLVAALVACSDEEVPTIPEGPLPPTFSAVQPDLFGATGAQPNAWADYDGDGDLDLFVGFRGLEDRLYRNDRGTFVDVAADLGLADPEETRAAAWGDYDLDGDPDLFIGRAGPDTRNRLYRNDREAGFTDVAAEVGVDRGGVTRQPAFVDYDGDGDLDLSVAFRDGPNALFRNDGGTFVDVAAQSGVADPRRAVGTSWFDMDGDGDLDLFVANQNGDEDAVFYNRGDGTFEDVTAALAMGRPGRPEDEGSVGTAVADYDNDGDLDLFVASYGPDALWQNQGDGTFTDVAPGTPLAESHHSVSAAWGDFDNDGWVDLFVNTRAAGEPEAKDFLFRNTGSGFEDVTPLAIVTRGSSHGVQWADYDLDGDLDLALANNEPGTSHPLYQNTLPAMRGGWSLQVGVTNPRGIWNRAGTTITLTRESDGYVTSRLLDAGGGYASQGIQPVHFGLPPAPGPVSLSIVWYEAGARRSSTVSGIDPGAFRGQWVVLQLGVG
ncbi:MAG: CRTAC1 family protein [Gemmatimonadota bacterium]|nr:CRTAC1 family protein [Gemmatimonadota bacterium]